MVLCPIHKEQRAHITVTSQWARRRLKSPALRLFTQPFIQVKIKENIKAPRHWPLCGEFTGDRASNAEKVSIWWRHHETTWIEHNETWTKWLTFRRQHFWPGDKPLSEPMMSSLLTHTCVTRPQWVNYSLKFVYAHSELYCWKSCSQMVPQIAQRRRS